MEDAYLGEIRLVGFGFAPRGWAVCDGSLLSIAQNSALFSLLGTTFGGDGRVTFALPDLRGRVACGQGTGPGLPAVQWGEVAGSPTVTLLSTQMPSHTHLAQLNGVSGLGATNNPGTSELLAQPNDSSSGNAINSYAPASAGAAAQFAPGSITVGPSGGSQPVNIQQPYLGLFYIICMAGVFPSRN